MNTRSTWAMDKLGAPPMFDSDFRATFLAAGLGAALRELAERHDLGLEEREAIRVTLAGIQIADSLRNDKFFLLDEKLSLSCIENTPAWVTRTDRCLDLRSEVAAAVTNQLVDWRSKVVMIDDRHVDERT